MGERKEVRIGDWVTYWHPQRGYRGGLLTRIIKKRSGARIARVVDVLERTHSVALEKLTREDVG
jgi:hypothetical protein